MRVRLKLDRLTRLVAESRLSQNHWAIKIGISRGHWSAILSGKHPFPSPRTRDRMCEVFAVPFDELFDIESGPDGADATFQAALADRYLVEKEIGQGGMATVYLARDVKRARTVALKIISTEAVSGIGVERFVAETRFTARLQHHNILPLYDSGIAAGFPYYAIPVMHAGSLRNLLERRAPLALSEVTEIVDGISQALQYAHDHQVLHCDVKPENILLSEYRKRLHPYVADFGISRTVHAEYFEWGRRGEIDSSAGTPVYVSPEQASGETNLKPTSDVYSLGCVAYEMITGRQPFGGASAMETVAQRFTDPVPDARRFAPHVSARVAQVVVRAMALDPADRFQTVLEFHEAFADAVTHPRPRLVESGMLAISRARRSVGKSLGLGIGRWRLMDEIRQDLRYAVRSLIRRPSFALIVLITMALGIGMNTAIFSVLYGALLQPLPFEDPDRVLAMGRTQPAVGSALLPISVANYTELHESLENVDFVEATSTQTRMFVQGDNFARVVVRNATGEFFSLLGVQPVRGRALREDDTIEGAPPVAVLNFPFWRDRLGRDENVIGSTIILDEVSHTVVGVAPEGFRFGSEELWVPFRWTAELRGNNRAANFLRIYGRLAPGATIESAISEMHASWTGIGARFPESFDQSGMSARPFGEYTTSASRGPLWLLGGAVLVVLIIASANVANLLLARAETRQREIAVRIALGAPRNRLLRQFITESVVVSVVGGAIGVMVAFASVRLLVTTFADAVPQADRIGINVPVLAFALAVSVGIGVLVGLAPALHLRGGPQGLREGARGASGRVTVFRKGLVVMEIGLSLLLVVGAGLLLRSFWLAQRENLGFDREGLIVANMWFPDTRYAAQGDYTAFFDALNERLNGIPEVQSTAMSNMVPLREFGFNWTSINLVGREEVKASFVEARYVTPSYFATLGIPILRGRGLALSDIGSDVRRVVINEDLERRLVGDGSAIGQMIDASGGMEIIGVAGNVRQFGVDREPRPTMYFANRISSNLIVRTSGDGAVLQQQLSSIVRSLDPNVRLYRM